MLFNPVDSRWLYNIVDTSMRMMKPVSEGYLTVAKQLNRASDLMSLPGKVPFFPDNHSDESRKRMRHYLRTVASTLYIYHMLTDTYSKKDFDIDEVQIDNEIYDITEVIIKRKSFCDLLHFKKLTERDLKQPKLLLVAPMSGHYATLLKQTVI